MFAIGPRRIALPGWHYVDLGQGTVVSAHPDLPLTHVRLPDRALTLLGHMLDPERPSADNREILASVDTAGLGRLCGRWVLVETAGTSVRVFNDATGTRQVYFGGGWCAAQPEILAHVLGLLPDAQSLDFLQRAVLNDKEYYWPSKRTLYADVELLLPNHHLDLSTGRQSRYWPSGPLTARSLEEGAQQSASMLRAIMLAASKRFPLAFPLTAGIDSRKALAASRDITGSILFYTLIYYALDRRHPDVRIPASILRDVGVPHHVIRCPRRMSDEFQLIYGMNGSDPHPALGSIAEGILTSLPDDAVCVRGSGSEIARCYYAKARASFSPEGLAALAGHRGSDVSAQAFSAWIRDLEDAHNYDVLDLFYWESRMGSWAARGYTEWDIAQDVFSPYNCRDLLVTMLGVPPEDRRPPENRLHRRIIEILWPQLLRYPINPPRLLPRLLDQVPSRVRSLFAKHVPWRVQAAFERFR
jgi:hypothetical protein